MWPLKANRVHLWDMPEFVRLKRDIPTAEATLAQCNFGSPFQKCTLMLAPLSAARALAQYLSAPICTCSAHAEHAIGARAALSAAYPPRMCHAIADFFEAATS